MTLGGTTEEQAQQWSAVARKRSTWITKAMAPLHRAMLDSLRVHQGTRFLDAGCGSGNASVIAAEYGAEVKGLDLAEEMIALAKELVPSGEFTVGDLQFLPYEDNSFDAVLACNCVMIAAKPADAIAELRRVCVPGGRIAVSALGAPPDWDKFVLWETIFGLLPAPPAKNPFILSAPGVLEAALEQAGLRILVDQKVLLHDVLEDFEALWDWVTGVGPLKAAIDIAGAAHARTVLEQAVARFRAADGSIVLNSWEHHVTCTK